MLLSLLILLCGFAPVTEYADRPVWEEAASSISLTMQGSCPGPITLTVQNANPGGTIALAFAPTTGSSVIPPHYACGGTVLGLGSRPRLVLVVGANGSGNARIVGNLPSGACGRYVQVVDLSTCNVSNVVQL